MRGLADIALLVWLPIALVMFATLRRRTAILCTVLGGTMFLPIWEIKISGLPDYDKSAAIGAGLVLGIGIFHSKVFFKNFRINAYDIPLLVWCGSTLITVVTNQLKLYDGVSMSFALVVSWAIPYIVGRTFFNDREGLKTLAVGIVVAGLVYLPFCLWEGVMSPRLHKIIYGYRQHSFSQARRGEGWRPMVFMQHGLAVAMFMTCSALVATWLWIKGSVKQIFGVPMAAIALSLTGITVFCRSMGAVLLLCMGLGSLYMSSRFRSSLCVGALLCIPLVYMTTRATNLFSGDILIEYAGKISETRAQSLETRLVSENALVDRALERPLFGWGGYSRSAVVDEKGRRRVETEEGDKLKIIQDGFWVITLGQRGLVGLASLTAILLLPGVYLIRKFKRDLWVQPGFAPMAALMVMLAIHMIDNLLNAMLNPMFPLTAGALFGYLDQQQNARRIRQRTEPRLAMIM